MTLGHSLWSSGQTPLCWTQQAAVSGDTAASQSSAKVNLFYKKVNTVMEVMGLRNVQSQQGRWNTLPQSHYVSPNILFGLGALSILLSALGWKPKSGKHWQAFFFFSFWLITSLSWDNGLGCPSCVNRKKVQRDRVIRRSEKKETKYCLISQNFPRK